MIWRRNGVTYTHEDQPPPVNKGTTTLRHTTLQSIKSDTTFIHSSTKHSAINQQSPRPKHSAINQQLS